MKKILLFIALALSMLIFSSCRQEEYSSSLTSKELSDALRTQISGSEDYIEYTDEELSYFDFAKNADADITVLYSRAAEDVGEVGVIRVSKDDAKDTKASVEKYLETQRTEKAAFFKNYAPGELLKLERAEVRHLGDYIIFTVLSSADNQAVFNKAEEILK
jgi:hypothetical protein